MNGNKEVTYANEQGGEPEIPSYHSTYEVISQDEFESNIIEDSHFKGSDGNIESPLDLRVVRLPTFLEFQNPIIHAKKKKEQVISIAELLENFHYDESTINYNSSSRFVLGNNYSNEFENNSLQENDESNFATDYSVHRQSYSPMSYAYSDKACKTQQYWNVGTSKESILLVDSQTQTCIKDTKDVSVQTDVEHKILPYTGIQNTQKSNAKFSCSICQRMYCSKGTYERHLRTHLVITNKKSIISSAHFTTETKLELYKKQAARKHQPVPFVIQMPRPNHFQCDFCKESFTTQIEKDKHFEDCIIEPFFMNKCPECPIKFYTFECLNQHIDLVHKKPSATNAYYCIFCNENFDSAFTFQVHLDKHLSP